MTRAELRDYIAELYEAFPDVHVEEERIITSDNGTAVEWTFHGTHEGEFEGIPPTEETVALPFVSISCSHATWRAGSDSSGVNGGGNLTNNRYLLSSIDVDRDSNCPEVEHGQREDNADGEQDITWGTGDQQRRPQSKECNGSDSDTCPADEPMSDLRAAKPPAKK